jgi:hypothetical protein
MTQLTELSGRVQAGDVEARNALFATAYSELHRLARVAQKRGGDLKPLTLSTQIGAEVGSRLSCP